jgi:uncharacterized ion transporter superfamily protein YfcC
MTQPISEPTSQVSGAPLKVPDTFLIILILALVAYGATWLIAPGVFQMDGTGRVIPGSYIASTTPDGAPLFGTKDNIGLLNFLFEGLVSGGRSSATVGLMAFMLVIGGAFGVIMRTGAVDRALTAVLPKEGGGDGIIAILFVAFSLAGAVFGMGEEAIAISLILVPALMRAGYDSITGILCCYVATQVGFATSWMNPFSVIVAQSIAGLPIMSGLIFRVVMWTLFTAIGALYVWRYARSVRLDPLRSMSRSSDQKWVHKLQAGAGQGQFGLGDALIMLALGLGIIWVAWGVVVKGYYLAEIAAQFMAVGLVAGIIGRIFRLNGVDGNDLVEAFRDGAVQLAPAVLIVAAAKGIVLILGGDSPSVPSLLNTLLHGMGSLTALLPNWATAWGMLVFQTLINFFIVSGSGQAAITMPLMAPLADLSGVSRQTAVLAFQLGDGLTNVVVPTSGALMGCLAAARLDFTRWLTFFWKPMLGLFGLSSAFVLGAHAMGYS